MAVSLKECESKMSGLHKYIDKKVDPDMIAISDFNNEYQVEGYNRLCKNRERIAFFKFAKFVITSISAISGVVISLLFSSI